MSYRILTIDGGGIRGVYAATLLNRLEAAVPGFLASVDFFAGTSTGGILALGLAHGATPNELSQLYRKCGPAIFHLGWSRRILSLGGLIGTKYDDQALYLAMLNFFGLDRLESLPKRVLVPAFQLDNQSTIHRTWKPKFFHNFPGPDSDGDQTCLDVAMRSCAAPIYFQPYQGYIDGGVAANNPCMAAVAQALDPRSSQHELSDLRVLSLGTGSDPEWINKYDPNWGIIQWAKPLVSLLMDGVVDVASFECRQILRDKFHRLAPDLPELIQMDDADSINRLVAMANDVVLEPEFLNWLQTTFMEAAAI